MVLTVVIGGQAVGQTLYVPPIPIDFHEEVESDDTPRAGEIYERYLAEYGDAGRAFSVRYYWLVSMSPSHFEARDDDFGTELTSALSAHEREWHRAVDEIELTYFNSMAMLASGPEVTGSDLRREWTRRWLLKARALPRSSLDGSVLDPVDVLRRLEIKADEIDGLSEIVEAYERSADEILTRLKPRLRDWNLATHTRPGFLIETMSSPKCPVCDRRGGRPS